MRIAIAKFGQETSSFSPVATTVDTFRLYGLYEGQELLTKAEGVGAVGGFLEAAKTAGIDWTPVPLFGAWAGASGIITADTLQYFEEKLIAGLQAARPVDAFFFDLHGAGQSENIPDTEGHLLAISREILGDDVPIVIALDHHANLTQMMVDNADGLVAHRTQPHDPFDTGLHAGRMLFAWLRGEIRPTMAWRKIPMIAHQEQFLTSEGSMKAWFDLAREMETHPGVVSASPFPMQPWLDVPEGGWAVAVVTDNDPALANRLAAELASKAWELREQFWVMDSVSPEEAVRRAVAAEKGLVILSDTGDSVFGGATGDSTTILKEMLRQQVDQPALLTVVDREVVNTAVQAGEGSEITVMLGGKLDHNFGEPVEITAIVRKIGGDIPPYAIQQCDIHPSEIGRVVNNSCLRIQMAGTTDPNARNGTLKLRHEVADPCADLLKHHIWPIINRGRQAMCGKNLTRAIYQRKCDFRPTDVYTDGDLLCCTIFHR